MKSISTSLKQSHQVSQYVLEVEKKRYLGFGHGCTQKLRVTFKSTNISQCFAVLKGNHV